MFYLILFCSTADSLTAYLAHSLALREKPKSKLEELTLNGIAKYLMSDQCNNIITMAGAGISTCKFEMYAEYLFSL